MPGPRHVQEVGSVAMIPAVNHADAVLKMTPRAVDIVFDRLRKKAAVVTIPKKINRTPLYPLCYACNLHPSHGGRWDVGYLSPSSPTSVLGNTGDDPVSMVHD